MKQRSLLILLGALALVTLAFVSCADVAAITPGFGFFNEAF